MQVLQGHVPLVKGHVKIFLEHSELVHLSDKIFMTLYHPNEHFIALSQLLKGGIFSEVLSDAEVELNNNMASFFNFRYVKVLS